MNIKDLLKINDSDHEFIRTAKDILSDKYYYDPNLRGWRTKSISAEVSAASRETDLSYIVAAAQTEALTDVIEIMEALIQDPKNVLMQKRLLK